MATNYAVELRDVRTGFMFIGELIGRLAQEGYPEGCVFGFEASYGCLGGSFVGDKDKVNAFLKSRKQERTRLLHSICYGLSLKSPGGCL